MTYMYHEEAYVWPWVRELKERRRCSDEIGDELRLMLRVLLRGFSGVCNINYKVRTDGRPALFEVNTRVGGDLAKDMPRDRAAAFFEALDQLSATGVSSEGLSSF